jgi:hypothetical protein
MILSRVSVCLRSLILLTSLTHVGCSGDDDGGGSPDTGGADVATESGGDAATPDTLVTDTLASDSAVSDTLVADTLVADTKDASADVAPACNTLVLPTSAVPDEYTADAHPTYVGGTLADGTYVLTKHVRYGETGTSTTSSKARIVIAGGKAQFVAVFGGGSTKRSNFDLATSTNAITFTRTCPSASSETQLYTATATTIEYCECDPTGPKGEGLVFTKE